MTELVLNPYHEAHIRMVAVTFRVSAPGLDPDAVTAATRLLPDSQARQGDERRTLVGGLLLQPEREGRWSLGTRGKLNSKDVRAHFRWLHARLLPHAAALQALAAGGETFFDVLWKSTYLYAGTGPLLDADSIAGVAALGAGMGFDIYQVNEETKDDAAALE